MKTEKTNVMRILDQRDVSYDVHTYDPDSYPTGEDVAQALGEDPGSVFKTLVTVCGKTGEHFVFVIPVCAELDLKKAAKASGSKEISMIRQKELLPLTGYVHGGCSPIGMKKVFSTYVDETYMLYDRISFSAGKRGVQVTIASVDLFKAVEISSADLV